MNTGGATLCCPGVIAEIGFVCMTSTDVGCLLGEYVPSTERQRALRSGLWVPAPGRAVCCLVNTSRSRVRSSGPAADQRLVNKGRMGTNPRETAERGVRGRGRSRLVESS
eukprot:scaffold482_cov247-Pinguiococcus_pyrenoidosus.AAC.27